MQITRLRRGLGWLAALGALAALTALALATLAVGWRGPPSPAAPRSVATPAHAPTGDQNGAAGG